MSVSGLILPGAKIIHPENLVIEAHSRIDDFCLINAAGGVKIGRYSAIHSGTRIIGGGRFEMGDYSVITYNCVIVTGYPKHTSHMSTMVPREFKDTVVGEVILGDEVFVGSNSVIMPGIHIGDGAVIAALSYIDRDIPPWTIVYPEGGKVKWQRRRRFTRQFSGTGMDSINSDSDETYPRRSPNH